MSYAKEKGLTTFRRKSLPCRRLRVEGFEPPHLSVPDPKSGASASSAIPALHAFYLSRTRSPTQKLSATAEDADTAVVVLPTDGLQFRR